MAAIFMLCTFSSCRDPVNLPIRVEEKKLAVERFISNQPPPYIVTINCKKLALF
jgi:hypothetical protein